MTFLDGYVESIRSIVELRQEKKTWCSEVVASCPTCIERTIQEELLIESGRRYDGKVFKRLKQKDSLIEDAMFEECVFKECQFNESLFRSCRFSDCVFDGCALSLAQLRYCSMTLVEFRECKCVGVNWATVEGTALTKGAPFGFEKCTLTHATFMGMTLTGLQLVECEAGGADFRQADLTGADFGRTNLTDALFDQTNLTKADFRYAKNYAIDATRNTLTKTRFAMPEALALLHALNIDLS